MERSKKPAEMKDDKQFDLRLQVVENRSMITAETLHSMESGAWLIVGALFVVTLLGAKLASRVYALEMKTL